MAIPLGDPERARTVTLTVSSAVFARIVEHARKARTTPGEFVLAMFEKGCATGGDRDAAIARLQEDLSAARKAEGALRATLASRDWELKQAATITMSAPDSGGRIARLEQERDAARSEAATLRRKAEEAGRSRMQQSQRADALADEVRGARETISTMQREAAQWQELIERQIDDIGVLRTRISDLEAQPPAPAEPTELTAEQIRLVSAYRSAGWSARDIARELNAPAVLVSMHFMRKAR